MAGEYRALLRTAAIGAALAALCCFAPVLILLFGAVGLSAWLTWFGYILLPALLLLLVVAVWTPIRHHKQKERC